MRRFFFIVMLVWPCMAVAQVRLSPIWTSDSIRITVDLPAKLKKSASTIIVFYALPNGNTTEQTIGKKMEPGDDWHFDIQHIGAQTNFLRTKLKRSNLVVIYLENKYKSWPAWKQKTPDYKKLIPVIIDSLVGSIPGRKKSVYLNGHSGGGSFIFGYINGVEAIPSYIKRISFLDSDYGYDSSYYPSFRNWLTHVRGATLNVFAYNDSVVVYQGKPLVSPTGGTWYRSWLFLKHLEKDFRLVRVRDDSLIEYRADHGKIDFLFRKNPEGKILHTVQVERNGFIHSILLGTKYENSGYEYFGIRAYE